MSRQGTKLDLKNPSSPRHLSESRRRHRPVTLPSKASAPARNFGEGLWSEIRLNVKRKLHGFMEHTQAEATNL